jgi:hypothetical protein
MEQPRHCCDDMNDAVTSSCADHPDRYDCADALIDYSPKFDEYGLIIHDGGTSSRQICFCPFCGAALPASKRDQWFEALEARGIDPDGSSVPDSFESDRWWREGS